MNHLIRACLLILAAGALMPVSIATARAGDVAALSEDRFWSLIEASGRNGASPEVQAANLQSSLEALSVADIREFDRIFHAKFRAAYSWDLWGAAYVIHGGASDDSFDFFRCWLISRGRAVFEKALADPDSLASLIPAGTDTPLEFPGFGAIQAEAWAAKTGSYAAAMPLPAGVQAEGEPSGLPFEEDEASLARRYPLLWARFGRNPLH